MNYDQVLALLHLGLPPGADEQAIKHAYAKRLNDCSPETDAEAWMQLHNAYKIVLSSLTDAKDPPSFDCIVELPPLNSPEHLFAAENEDGKSEFDELFDEMENLAEFARQQEEQRKKNMKQQCRLSEMSRKGVVKKLKKERSRRRNAKERSRHGDGLHFSS